MKNVTRPDDTNKYYMYKGFFITKEPNGLYSCHTGCGCFKADTQKGMKTLLNSVPY